MFWNVGYLCRCLITLSIIMIRALRAVDAGQYDPSNVNEVKGLIVILEITFMDLSIQIIASIYRS